ncbi:MAG: hypothetical protein QME78_18365, partial [Thermodesulfobacteriota bacterium]|nr:hypothetical protein [Thermodesulfobacteriota bacterium]
MSETDQELKLLEVIHQNFSPDYLLIVIQHALEHRREATVPSRKFLEEGISRLISISGFRSPFKAPVHLVAQYVLKEIAIIEPLLFGVLRVWAETRSDLRDALKHFC